MYGERLKMSNNDDPLTFLQGKFTPLKKMSVKQKNIEIEAWRNLWGYVPSEVKDIAGDCILSSLLSADMSPPTYQLAPAYPLNTIY